MPRRDTEEVKKGEAKEDLTGRRFGKLTVTGRAPAGSRRGSRWWVRCDCGTQIACYRADLFRPHWPKRSCGCDGGQQANTSTAVWQREWTKELLLVGHRTIDGTGTFRRVEALQCLGWSIGELERQLGWSERRLHNIMRGSGRILRRNAEEIKALYDRLWDKPAVPKDGYTKSWISRTKRLAASKKLVPPLGWDDESIDDPNAEPKHRLTKSQLDYQRRKAA